MLLLLLLLLVLGLRLHRRRCPSACRRLHGLPLREVGRVLLLLALVRHLQLRPALLIHCSSSNVGSKAQKGVAVAAGSSGSHTTLQAHAWSGSNHQKP